MLNKKIIDRLSIVFLLLFFFLTIYISFYAAGYRINWQWPLSFNQFFVKTGMLIVETSPNRVNIFLEKDSEGLIVSQEFKKNYQSPAKIQNLLPGKYIIILSQAGYWPLTRKIHIEPNQTTHLTDIFLFKKSLPLNIYNYQKEEINISPDQKKILLVNSGIIFSLENETIINLENYQKNKETKWISEDKLINWLTVYDLKKQNILIDLSDINEEVAKIYFNQKNNQVFYQNQEGINYFTLNKKDVSHFLNIQNIQDFISQADNFHILEENQNKVYLHTYLFPSALKQRSIALPNGNYKFKNTKNNFLTIYDSGNKRLVLINNAPFSNQQDIINNVNEFSWINNQEIIWRNNKEIHHYNLETNQKKLLIRLSQNITGISWNKLKNYLIYSTKETIKIVYFQANKINTINLFNANDVELLFLDEKSALIYFYAKIDQQEGLFKLLIE
jgi:hypothetical protein